MSVLNDVQCGRAFSHNGTLILKWESQSINPLGEGKEAEVALRSNGTIFTFVTDEKGDIKPDSFKTTKASDDP